MNPRSEQARERALGAAMLGGAVLLALLIAGARMLFGGSEDRPVSTAPAITLITPTTLSAQAPAAATAPAPALPQDAPATIPAGAPSAAAGQTVPPTIISEAPATSQTPAPQQTTATGQVVCIDPGHGGADLGNVRVENGEITLREKDFTLQHSLALGKRLEQMGYQVVYTRTADAEANPNNLDANGDGIVAEEGGEARSDQLDDLQARVLICNQGRADALVSVHYNGAENEFLEGYEVWYNDEREFSDRSARLATLAHEELGKAFAVAGYEANDRGIGTEAHALTGPARPGKLVPSEMPGVVVEGLFLSNEEDAAFIQTPQAEEAIVTAYATAIDRFLQEEAT